MTNSNSLVHKMIILKRFNFHHGNNNSCVSIIHLCWCVIIKLCICVSMCERINYVVHIRCLVDLSDCGPYYCEVKTEGLNATAISKSVRLGLRNETEGESCTVH